MEDNSVQQIPASDDLGNAPTEPPPAPKRPRGFAAMDPALRRELCRKGGKRAHEIGVAHEWDSASASIAGKRGGLATSAKKAAKRAAA